MSTIIAMCPYCRVGGVRAPATALGASATCPKCKSSFTVMPSETAPDRVAHPSAETAPVGALADETEPSPLVPAGEQGLLPAKARPKSAKARSKHAKPKYPVARVIAPPPPRPADVGIGSVVAPPPAEPPRDSAPSPSSPASSPASSPFWAEVIETTYPLEEIAERPAQPSPHPARPASRSEPPSPQRGGGPGEGKSARARLPHPPPAGTQSGSGDLPLKGGGQGITSLEGEVAAERSAAGGGKATGPVTAPQPRPVAVEEADEPEEAMDYGMAFALGALILVGPAVLASQLPFGRFIAAGLGAVGLLGGVAALGSEGRAKAAAAGAVFLHAMILLVVFFIPSVLSLDPWLGNADDAGPQGPFVVEHGSGERKPITPDTWIDANRSSWECQDVRVTIVAARTGPVQLTGPKDAKRNTKEKYLQLQLRVTNVGVERELSLSAWAAGQGTEGLRLTDPTGKALAPATFDAVWCTYPRRGSPTPCRCNSPEPPWDRPRRSGSG
jgi:hypothetical protein